MYQTRMIDEFEQMQKKQSLAIIDVREVDEYASGHIKEAINLPLSQLSERVGELDNEQEYYIICHSGGRSQMASEFLSAKGYQVINVLGGMSAFKGEITYEL